MFTVYNVHTVASLTRTVCNCHTTLCTDEERFRTPEIGMPSSHDMVCTSRGATADLTNWFNYENDLINLNKPFLK